MLTFTLIGYPHNTYHGPAKHYRPMLNNLGKGDRDRESGPDGTKPMWFTDSPQHYVPAIKSLTPMPSPRRKSSSASIEATEVSMFEYLVISLHVVLVEVIINF